MRTWIEKNEFNEDVECTEHDSGHIIKELKMTEAQKAQMKASAEAAEVERIANDPMTKLMDKLEKMEKDIAEIKAKQK